MLILARRLHEGITIETSHGPIHVDVVEIQRGKVRLGIDAPVDCRILRDEIVPEVKHE